MTVTFHPLLQAGSLTLFVKDLSLSLCHDCLIGFYHLILSDVQDVGFIVLLPSITDEVSNEVTVVSCFLNYDMPYLPRGHLSLPGAWSFILSVFVLRETSTPKFLVQAQISFLSIKPTHSHVYLTHSPRVLIISYLFFWAKAHLSMPHLSYTMGYTSRVSSSSVTDTWYFSKDVPLTSPRNATPQL